MLFHGRRSEEIQGRLLACKKALPIGTKYEHYRCKGRICTVTDYYETRNQAGELVGYSIIASHETMGQVVTDYDVTSVEIAKSMPIYTI